MPALPKKPRSTRPQLRTRRADEQPAPPREERRGGIDITDGSQVTVAGNMVGGNQTTNISTTNHRVTNIVVHLLPKLLRIPPQIPLAVILVGLLLWPTFEYGGRMGGLFNIAIADFGQIRSNGRLGLWETSGALREALGTGLTRELSEVDALVDDVRIRSTGIGIVPGRTAEDRQRAARRIAEQINANVLIYGTVERIDATDKLAPEFYVRAIAGAEEILGRTQIGTPVASPGMVVSGALRARSEAMTYLAIGLTYFSVKLFGESASWYERALGVQAWRDTEGKEVVYLLLGTARMGPTYLGGSESSDLAAARKAYEAARDLNGDYSRAYIGLGNVAYEEFRKGSFQEPALLDLAIDEYGRARQAPLKPSSAQVDAKLHLNLGYALMVKAQIGDPATLAQAEAEFQAIVTPYEHGNTALRGLAGRAYLGLGVVSERGTADYPRAAALYRKCIETAEDEGTRKSAETQLRIVEAQISKQES